VGCLRNFQLNSKNVGDLRHSVGVIPCSDKVERGVFFPHTGGQIVARKYHLSYWVFKINNFSYLVMENHWIPVITSCVCIMT
jgi:hypothetical protein